MIRLFYRSMHRFSVYRHRTAALAILVFAFSFLQAQSYQRKLTWESKNKTFTTVDGKQISQPTFAGAGHHEKYNLLPVYAESIPLSTNAEVSAKLINAVYFPVSIDNTITDFIKPEADVTVAVGYQRKKPTAYIEILPFRKNAGGQLERLESFTLQLSVTPKYQHRAGNSYASNSVLASGSWYKIAVTADGMYKIDFNFVKNTLGVNPANINLSKLAIFGNGGGMLPDRNSIPYPDDLLENPTLLVDNNGNNQLDQDDYLLFYGQMADKWIYNPNNQTFSHEKNLFSDKNFYFLTTDAGTGKRVSVGTVAGSPNLTITEFDDYGYRDNDEENTLKSGRIWLGDKMTSFNKTRSFTFNFPNLITSVPVKFISAIAAKTTSPYGSTTVASINGQSLITHVDGGINPNNTYPPGAIPYTATANYNATSPQLTVSYTFNVNADPAGTAAAYINWFELHVKRSLSMSGDFMPFRSIASVGAGNISEFRLQNASGNTRVWHVSNVGDIQQMPATLSNSQLSFTAETDVMKEFIAFNTNGSFGTPQYISKIANQNLHATGQPDMIIVTYDGFLAASEDLAQFHWSSNGISTKVVKLSELYNEFSCGKPDISAIRNFMRMLYDRAGSDTALLPRYLLLMGDGSYDPKDRVAGNKNFVPTYQSYESYIQTSTFTSDDFYGLLDDNEGGDINDSSQKLDVSIGRLPVETEQEAWEVVNKIKNYKRPSGSGPACVEITSNNSWRNIVTFIADDEDYNTHLSSTEYICETTRTAHPEYNYDKIYLDAYKQQPTPAGDRYPDVNNAILNRLNSGSLIINWIGHGGETNWAHERIFNMSDIVQLQNKERLPLFITATCEFSRFDLPERTAGEWLVVNGKGGAIASITTVRLVYSNANEALNKRVFDYMFMPYEDRDPTLGELTMETKNTVNTDINNTRKFVLLGDPALQINYPRYNVATTHINNHPVSQTADTLKALSLVTIKGEIRDDNDNKLSSFNGVVYPMVYDKISKIKTLKNDPLSNIVDFNLYKNILFKGKASVTNGEFSFSFIVPKDIDYQYGKGRISYYADNGNYIDANGYNQDIVIGGSVDSFGLDAIGPELKIFMNDEKFVFGGTTNESPILLVKLVDSSGVNTVGNGIGHDLIAELDNNTQNRIMLNDYYESELDNFRAGTIKYPFSKLKEGRHTLKVKAWDIHNNSSEDFTEFVVASSAKLALTHVFNYPNPFTTHTKFMFEHNKPCDDLSVSIQIYTVSGKVVKSIRHEVKCDGYRVDDIEWNGLDDYGDPIGKGVYVYKVNVRDSGGNTAHKFEKLVVLR
ncbi:MAG: type IX secretion system sortase PorU [Chitinophagales bacterium]|nr:type IX secretion system sortase PorU [Chitinophagales bacterium]